MAGESLFGGGSGQTFTPGTIALLDSVLGDTVNGEVIRTELGNGTEMVVGTGANGETQGAIVTNGTAVAATVTMGSMTFTVQIPSGIAITFEGSSTPQALGDIKNSLDNQIQTALNSSDPAIVALNISLTNAVNNLFNALNEQGVTDSTLRVIDFSDNSGLVPQSTTGDSLGVVANADPNQTVVFDASDSDSNEIFALLLGNLNATNKALELKGVESALLVGDGTVFVGDNTNTNLQGDTRDQHMTGGGGNDTLVGGGGNDTMIGGEGDDTFGFNALGNYTVELGTNDKLAFQFDGINTVDDLIPFITDVTQSSDGNITYEFVDGAATITLVGVSVDDITIDLLQFDL